MKTKFFALGAVLLMCITAFACVSIVSDDSYAASSGTAGSISHPLSGTATLYTSSYYTGSQTYMYGLVVPGTVITVIDNVSHGAFSFESTSGWNVSGNTYTKTISGKDDSLRIAGIGFSFYPVRNVGIIDADNFVPAGQGGTTSSDPALGINASNIEWMDPQRYYVAKGSSINATENNDDLYAYLTTQIPGLTMSNGTLSGTVTANGTYTVYTEIQPIMETDSGQLIVVDAPPSYAHTVHYDGNGSTGGSTADTVITDSNSGTIAISLASCGFTKSGAMFVGWKIGNTTYQPGQTVSVAGNSSVTAVAQWSENTLTASAGNLSAVSGLSYSNQIGATASNGGSLSYAVKSCTGGTASVNTSGKVTYAAPSVSSTAQYTVTVTVTASYPDGSSLSRDVSFTVTVDPVLSFTNAATSGTLSVKGA